MLQQTRVAAAIPYYQRFLERFPTAAGLAAAPEDDVLTLWAGLGYYLRARNLHRAAKQIAERGAFPATFDEIRALTGVGSYTAAAVASIAFDLPHAFTGTDTARLGAGAAVASIAFDLPHAVLDGNVMRVLSRVVCEPGDIGSLKTRARLQAVADRLLDTARPGAFNQAIMELGATLCSPRDPRCLLCPVSACCRALAEGRQEQFPVKLQDRREVHEEKVLLRLERGGKLLMWRRPPGSTRMQGFWELPEAGQISDVKLGRTLGEFRHSITFNRYRFRVVEASVRKAPAGFEWIVMDRLPAMPVSTIARKALKIDTLRRPEV